MSISSGESIVTIPQSWSITESANKEDEQRIAFSFAVMKHDSGLQIPVIQRCVLLKSDRSLKYCVYGNCINVDRTTLPQFLEDINAIPNILKMFQNMNICNGIGPVNNDQIPYGTAFQDHVKQWRHNQCFFVSKKRKCDFCMQLLSRINKQVWKKGKSTSTSMRVSNISNPGERSGNV